ncbi:MAG: N-acyl homoserine lactonase family protein [Desulfurococcales archaeon]|nr:N-acyl homoserine lactonase family protein [Desulfurococcales archaeon]
MGSGVKRVYLLDYGILSGDINWFLPQPSTIDERGKTREVKWVDTPVIGAVIEHKDGIVLLDTGSNPEAEKVWPKASWSVFPMTKFTDENRLENQLKLIGLKPEDIHFVVFTHLHLDHAGQAYIFRDLNTPLIAHKRELQYALYMIWIGKAGAYLPVDLEPLKGAAWHTFDGEHLEVLPGIDLYLVGGHTPGSIIMKVTTDAGNTYIFTGDFVHLPDELEAEAKGWLLGDAEEWYTNIRKLKLLARRPRTNLIISHDPKLWEKYPKAPKHLE